MKMPVVFSGHGDPMIAIREDNVTKEMKNVGEMILKEYGKPKAILSISAHWFTRGTFIQSANNPKQIYDMYGFPKKLYEVKYPVTGSSALTKRLIELLQDKVKIDDSWGIDHGTWTLLVHMFPDASIPVVQLSVDSTLSKEDIIELGKKLSILRDEGYLIIGSGNVVHNLEMVNWSNRNGSKETICFNDFITNAIINKEIDKVFNYETHKYSSYAVPTVEHYLPLLYCIAISNYNNVKVFNNVCNLEAIAMTGYIFD